MDYFVIAAIISALVVLVLSLAILRNPKGKQDATVRPRALEQRDGGPGRAAAMRNQRARMRANAMRHQAAAVPEEELVEEADEEAEQPQRNVDFDDKMGAKKRAKLEAKAERKAAREAEEHMREDKKKKELQQDEERRKKEQKEEEEERKREEELRKAEEEKKRKEEEEYQAMKAAFSVEGEGYEEEDDERENMLQEFKDYIMQQKVVLLDDLAARFKLKTQAAIDRITSLEADGTLTGVIDDRGKFIYISRQELQAVATFIRQRGRVSIAQLAESSNQLIQCNP